MMALLRKLFSLVLLLILVLGLALAALMLFSNPNKLKPIIVKEVNHRTGYILVIDGNLSWSFFPRLGVTVEHMTLRAPNETRPFADLNKVTIATSLTQLLRGSDKTALEGAVRIESLRLMKIYLQDATIDVHWLNNILTLKPVSASLYDGTVSGSIHGRDFSSRPVWDWDLKGDSIQLKPLLLDLNGNSKINISGPANVHFQAHTEGKDKDMMLRELNGTSTFTVTKGALEGIDLNYYVKAATALLTKLSLPDSPSQDRTEFESLTATAIIKNGMANIDDLLLISPVFATKGTGTIDLERQKLDYKLEVTPLQTEKIRWMVPVVLSGDLNSPIIHLDTFKLNALLANEEFEKVKVKVNDEIKKLPAKADKLLKKLLSH